MREKGGRERKKGNGGEGGVRERNLNSKTLFYKYCSLGSVKINNYSSLSY